MPGERMRHSVRFTEFESRLLRYTIGVAFLHV